MRSVSALDVRKHFGQLLDEAAAGERLIIERAIRDWHAAHDKK